MTETGFVKAQSDKLPKIDASMVTGYFTSNPDYTSTEIKGVKAARLKTPNWNKTIEGNVTATLLVVTEGERASRTVGSEERVGISKSRFTNSGLRLKLRLRKNALDKRHQ